MNQKSLEDLKKPDVESKSIWHILHGIAAYPAVVSAYDLGVFELLESNRYSFGELCEKLKLQKRAAEALLGFLVSLHLVEKKDELYELSDVARIYLLQSSPFSLCSILSVFNTNPLASSVDSLNEAIKQNQAQSYGGADVFESHAQELDKAKSFTKAMHSISMAPALYWPEKVDLSRYRTFLDVAGGSGAHSLGVLKKWDELNAIVLDIAPVCDVTDDVINEFCLSARMSTYVGDLWKSDFPSADVHFYSQIFHDWYYDKCEFLAKKSFDSLNSGGMIILHEVLLNQDKSSPFAATAASISMLRWTEGKQYSFDELREILRKVGFVNIATSKTGFDDWSIVTAIKP